MKRKIIRLIILIVGIGLIVSLSRDILRLLKAGDQVKLAQERVKNLEEEQAQLRQKEQYYRSDEFVEEEARNKLNMAKPEETIAILPQDLEQVLGRTKKEEISPVPNWQQWWKLFF